MTVVVPGVGVITRKPKWKQLLFPVEIPAARFSCLTSGSFRPKLGICILLTILTAFTLLLIPYLARNYKFTSKSATLSRRISAEAMDKSVDANDMLAGSLLEHLASGNLVMSSFSIGTVMGMVLAGAEGDTKKQILSLLRHANAQDVFDGSNYFLDTINNQQKSGNFTLRAANRVYTEKTFQAKADFSQQLLSFYKAEPMAMDFANDAEVSRGSINSWVKDQTNQKIVDLLPSGSIDPLTRMVLVNALYFKGDWANKFDPKDTEEADFHVAADKVVKVQMMHQKAKFGIAKVQELNGAMALRMPYKGDQLDMIFILPNEKDTLESMEKKLVKLDLKQHLAHFSTRSNVIVSVPKFKVESMHKLNEPLKKLGVIDMFDKNKADLSGISGDKSLFVSWWFKKPSLRLMRRARKLLLPRRL